MADSRKIIKVFLASPGDLSDERRAAKASVDHFNAIWGEYLGCHVELVGWEDTVSVFGRPQQTINGEMEKCELFLGIVWKRWGTSPALDGPYSSGFEEEYHLSVKRRESTGRPEVSLFFKDVDETLIADPGQELLKVLRFKQQIIEEKKILFETFSGANDFRLKMDRCITKYVQRLILDEAQATAAEGKEKPALNESKESAPHSAIAVAPLPKEGAAFLTELVQQSEQPGISIFEAVKVARLRLLGNVLKEQGNDDQTLGVHDANLLFTHKQSVDLSTRECYGLLKTGLAQIDNQIAPLWTWCERVDGMGDRILPFYSLTENREVAAGSLSAMRLIQADLYIDENFSRQYYLKRWLASDNPTQVKVAALNYLGECGVMSDLPDIRDEIKRADYQTGAAAVDASLRINLRESREAAVKCLIELQPETINPTLLNNIFDDSGIASETLTECLSHRSASVRMVALKMLNERGELSAAQLNGLVLDSDSAIRLEATLVRFSQGERPSIDDVMSILDRPKKSSGLINHDFYGEALRRQYRPRSLALSSIDELKTAIPKELIYDKDAFFELAQRRYKTQRAQLRKLLQDQFKAAYQAHIDDISARYASDSEFIEKVKSLETYVRQDLTRKALTVVARRGDKDDLGLVRQTLASGFVRYSTADVIYLSRFGTWADIKLFVESSASSQEDNILAPSGRNLDFGLCANAIMKVAKSRVNELLQLSMSPGLLRAIIVDLPNKTFARLASEHIIRLLNSSGDIVRRTVAQKCVLALTRTHLEMLLAAYQTDTWFYNVVYWLDFGIAVNVTIARAACKRLIANES